MDRQMWSMFHHLLLTVVVLILVAGHAQAKMGKIIFAVNSGGDSHTDVISSFLNYSLLYEKCKFSFLYLS